MLVVIVMSIEKYVKFEEEEIIKVECTTGT